MRRFWAAAAIILLLGLLSLLHVDRLSRFTGELIRQVEAVELCLAREDWDDARTLARQLDSRWEESGFFLHTTLHHGDIDSVRSSLREIQAYLDCGEDRAECLAACARLINQLELLAEAEEPSLKNLL